jgi:uncharacterized membrane protein YgaE (UPF0421/DUF939 family)
LLARIRSLLGDGIARLRANLWSVAQSAAAASLAFFLARLLLGHESPFFAPIAAVISLSVTLGSRPRRAVEMVFGVAVGLMVADLLVLVIGTGTLQIAAVVLLAMAAAVFFGGGTMLVNQAAVSSILVVVLQPRDAVFSPDRFLDALVGGGVALLVGFLLPANPERLVGRAVAPILEELSVEQADKLDIVSIDVDANPQTTLRYDVMSMPTLILFKDGVPQHKLIGARGKRHLLEELTPHIS